MKIYIAGGLGNQLFQLAYAHQNLGLNESTIQIISDPSPRTDRPFDLLPFLQQCSHTRYGHRNRLFYEKLMYLAERIVKKYIPNNLLLRNFISTKSFTEKNPFSFIPPNAKDSGVNFGYFQHWKYVESVWNTFGLELEKTIHDISLPLELNALNLSDTCVVHIRRGDNIRSMESMGILDLNYYEKAISLIRKCKAGSLKFIGITDDFLGAKKISEELGLDLLLGPSQISSWQSIALMAKSGAVICANSTFSWWGGILSAKKSGIVAIPNPWFINWHEEVGDAFLHPKLLVVNSSFLKTKDFVSDFEEL